MAAAYDAWATAKHKVHFYACAAPGHAAMSWHQNPAQLLPSVLEVLQSCAACQQTPDVVSCSMSLCEDVMTAAELYCVIGVCCPGHESTSNQLARWP